MKKNKKMNIKDQLSYLYIRNIKKWMFCPACKEGKMTLNKKASLWTCEDCGYNFSEEYFLDDCVFWFCDECNSYLNNQEGFDRNASRHVCQECGYENDTTFTNIKGVCSDCGKLLPNPEATLCADCRQLRRNKAKKLAVEGLKITCVAAVAVGAAYLASQTSSDDEDDDLSNYTPLPDCDNDDLDDEVFGLGDGIYPYCKTCGAEMTIFDNWAWYTCPECENKVRIIDGHEAWYADLFGEGTKQHYSDFDLADFCHGGDLSED